MRKNNQNKKQNLIIAVLAVLLIGLITVNITQAFFTDKKTGNQTLSFGKIALAVTDGGVNGDAITSDSTIVSIYNDDSIDDVLMPGSHIKSVFTVALADDSQDAWVRFKLTAKIADADIEAMFGHTFENKIATDTNGVFCNYNNASYKVVVSNGVATVYSGNGLNTALDPTEDAATIEAVLTYMRNMPNGVSYSESNGVVTFDYTDEDDVATNDLTDAAAQALSASYVTVMSQVETLGNQVGTATDSTNTAWYVGSDGYLYRNAVTNDSESLEINFEFVLSHAIANILQERDVLVELSVEAVQHANTTVDGEGNTDADHYAYNMPDVDEDVTFTIGNDTLTTHDPIDGTDTYANILYSARAFHSAIATHGTIAAK